MVSFRSFVTLVLSGMVVTPLELGMASNLKKRDNEVDCGGTAKAAFVSAS
jgi:hypothetical protein